VEDELEKNIPKMIRMFEKFLGHKICKELQALEEDEYGASADEIFAVFSKNNVVQIENSFPKALKIIVEQHQEFEFFIIDRNLSNILYEMEEIQSFYPKYDENFYNRYFEREGDLFLELLISNHIDVKQKFFFLTANSRDKLRNEDEIKGHIDFDRFCVDNFVDKSDQEKLIELKSRIENSQILNLVKENQRYLMILEQIDVNLKNTFITLLQKKDDTNQAQITANLSAIRVIYENLLKKFAAIHIAPDDCYNYFSKEKQLVMRATVRWISIENSEKFAANCIIKDFLYAIQEIASDFGAHRDYEKEGFQPTTNTVNSLVYGLKDILVWYDMNCE
jgi:hypothetical protein